MTLNDTVTQLGSLLSQVVTDLSKVHKGNKSAAQRVRVGTLDIEKLAKKFRKESVAAEKKGSFNKKLFCKKKRPTKKDPRKNSTRARRGSFGSFK